MKTEQTTPTLENLDTDRMLRAVMYCILAHFSFAVMGACAKYLSQSYHVAEIAFYRNLLIFIPMLLMIIISGKTHLFKTKKPKLMAARAILGGFSVMVVFQAVAELPLAYATVIFYTSSIVTPVLAFFFLKEHIGYHRWSAVLVGMCGVLIIAQPSGEISMFGLLTAIAAACIHAAVFTTLRGLKSESPITTTFYFMVASTIIPAFFLPWVAVGLSYDHIWLYALIAVSAGVGQYALSCAYKYAPASLVTPFIYTSLLWTILIDVFIWKINLDFISIFCGAGLIMCAQFYIIYREYRIKHLNA